ncbi:hypothetical protein PG991_003087 [Apiospora marii]|uniref:Uncharacterized protein n=1 Tax=Apiospora marii TaxID=335849 RepID=A0ABR1SH83_9PEZI
MPSISSDCKDHILGKRYLAHAVNGPVCHAHEGRKAAVAPVLLLEAFRQVTRAKRLANCVGIVQRNWATIDTEAIEQVHGSSHVGVRFSSDRLSTIVIGLNGRRLTREVGSGTSHVVPSQGGRDGRSMSTSSAGLRFGKEAARNVPWHGFGDS